MAKALQSNPIAAKAKLSDQKVSPVRFRQVADLVRGRFLEDANRQLLLNQKTKSARMLLKLLRSAMSNAEQKSVFDMDRLYISTLMVNEGPRIRRFFPRAQGRADVRLTRTSHIVLELSEKAGAVKAKAAKSVAKKTTKAKTKKAATKKAGE
jgi:large subunit ribosomal protein L22